MILRFVMIVLVVMAIVIVVESPLDFVVLN